MMGGINLLSLDSICGITLSIPMICLVIGPDRLVCLLSGHLTNPCTNRINRCKKGISLGGDLYEVDHRIHITARLSGDVSVGGY